MKRTSTIINNYNPILMTCVRSNHDIKFISSGKNGKSCAFYMTNYATKSSLSSHQMVPLIAASMKKIESSNSKLDDDVVLRSKSLITKCLNRIATETEMYICHFLMGHSDKKASHSFVCLNVHTTLCWVTEEISKDDNMNDSESDVLALEGNEHDDAGYTIEHGNTGLVVTNQFTDYRNRGKDLTEMSLYEYCSNVYKKTLTDDEKPKLCNQDSKQTRKAGCKPQPRYLFANTHPQSETHVQVLRAEPVIPSLSLPPPNENSNKERFQICMLVLFKPFVDFQDLYNGISWEDYFENTDFGEHLQGMSKKCIWDSKRSRTS